MPRYYFCNGNRKNSLPCSKPVTDEYDRCHFHGGAGGAARDVAVNTFHLGRKTIEAIVHAHAASEAFPWILEAAKNLMSLFARLGGQSFDFPKSENATYDRVAIQKIVKNSMELSGYMMSNEEGYVEEISALGETQFEVLTSSINVTLSIFGKYVDDETEGKGFPLMMV